jgi:hypothetical protein
VGEKGKLQSKQYRSRKSPIGNYSYDCYRQEPSMAAEAMGESFMRNSLKIK